MPALRVLPGGLARVRDDEAHVELVAARAERLVLADKLRGYTRSASRLLASGHIAAASTYLDEMAKVIEQDAQRAVAMACPDGCEGSGHGPASDDALAVPVRRVA